MIEVKNNFKYVAVFAIFWIVLMIGYADKNSIKSDLCVNLPKADSMMVIAPEISPRGKYYRISNFLNTANGDYYRLAFNAKVDQNSEIAIKLASVSGEEFPVSSLLFEAEEDYASKEVVFKAGGFYRDLIFEKKEEDDISKVYIKNVSLSRLNVKSEYEAKLLRPMILGDTKMVKSDLKQAEKREKYFSQLKSGGTKIGQIFKAEDEYMAGVSFDLRERGDSEKKYRVELKEAREKDGNFNISSETIASLEFSSDDMESYRVKDEGMFFPLTSRLENGKLYFVGIDNSLVNNNFLDYLEVRGTDDGNAFLGGEAIVWRGGKAKEVGDLFFTVHTIKFSDFQGERILTGAKIEDLGGGSGLYLYQTSQWPNDILDLSSYKHGDVWFNDYERIISGSPRNEAGYVYRFYSPFAFEKIRIISEQMYAGWYRVIISYSFDNQNWTELLYSGEGENDSPQKFNSIIDGNGDKKELYVKVTYDKFDDKEIKLFGLRNFSVTSELKMK